jgi:predicted metal-dependent phosphoesterase TrpH
MALAVDAGSIVGIEVLNASLAGRASRPHALRFAEQHGLAAVGSSDAHMLAMVGLCRTRFPGTSPDELRHALETATTVAEGRFATPREMASEAIPQLARSMLHLPLRRIVRYVGQRRQAGSGSH